MGTQSIQVHDYGSILSRLLGMSGVEEPAGDLSPEISAVLAVAVDRPEWKFLAAEKICQATQLVALSAGNRSVIRLRNPTGGPLAVVTNIQLSTSTAGNWTAAANIGAIGADRATPSGAYVNLDSRWGVAAGNGALILSGDNTAVAGTNFEDGAVAANITYRFQCTPVILLPGAFVEVYTVETDVALRATFRWTERPFTPYELPR